MNANADTIRLQSAHAEGCTLDMLLAAAGALAGGQRPIGWAATPQHWRFVALEEDALVHPEGLAIDQLIELRLLTGTHEWRWLRNPDAAGVVGRAACLSETGPLPADWTALPPLDGLTVLDGRRLLTGMLGPEDPPQAGWGWMHAPRHGRVAVPLADRRAGLRLGWAVREYIGPASGLAGDMGNRCVVEERLMGLDLVESARRAGPSEAVSDPAAAQDRTVTGRV